MEERKYFVKQSWIFNLESMQDKLCCDKRKKFFKKLFKKVLTCYNICDNI